VCRPSRFRRLNHESAVSAGFRTTAKRGVTDRLGLHGLHSGGRHPSLSLRVPDRAAAPTRCSSPDRPVRGSGGYVAVLSVQHTDPGGPGDLSRNLIEATARLPEGEIASASYPVEEAHLASFAAARTAQSEAKSARRHKPPIQAK
jgi:hypothetical protein